LDTNEGTHIAFAWQVPFTGVEAVGENTVQDSTSRRVQSDSHQDCK
jgi:hypothetical protein